MNHSLTLLGIARKAGLLAVGGDAVSAAARAGKAKLIISASDASERAIRRAIDDTSISRAIHINVPYTKFELGSITGRGSPGTVAILDTGLAAGFAEKLAKAKPEIYGGAAEILNKKARALTDKKKQLRG